MKREQALEFLKEKVQNPNLQKHCLAVEAVMRCLAKEFDADVEKWGLTGLLHDIDWEITKDNPERHSLEGARMLAEIGLAGDVVYAVKVHNDRHGEPRHSLLDKSLYATDPLTGFIVAAALIRPEKKLAAVELPFLQSRFREKAFARGANREQIQTCRGMGLTLEEFLGLGLEAMQEKAEDLGL